MNFGAKFPDTGELCCLYTGDKGHTSGRSGLIYMRIVSHFFRGDNMNTITVPASEDKLDEITAFIDSELAKYGCQPNMQIQMAVEEVFVNIASYAYENGGDAEITVNIITEPLMAEIIFRDSGVPFDPLAAADADTSEEAIEQREGGLGIYMIKTYMDSVSYAYEDGKNVLTVRKKLKQG